MELTGKTFVMPEGFDVDELFSTNFGVYLSEQKPITVTFKANHTQAGYLRDLPIHSLQQEISSDEQGVVFSIFVRPNNSLMLELTKLGSRIEVLSPESIREALAAEAASILEQYRRK